MSASDSTHHPRPAPPQTAPPRPAPGDPGGGSRGSPRAQALSASRERWDIICIGSGLTALAFAAQIGVLHPGKRVLIVEQHYVPGGYASRFRRRALVFDCSLHRLTGVRGEGHLGRIFRDLGLMDDLELTYSPEFFAVSDGGREIALSSDGASFKRELGSLFPEERSGLDQLFQEVETHGRNDYFRSSLAGESGADLGRMRRERRRLRKLTVKGALDERLREVRLKQILAAPCIYSGGIEEQLGYPYYLHILFTALRFGNAYVIGSAQRLSDELVRRVREAGGEVLLRTEVRRILVDESDRAYGVETTRGVYHGEHIYVNASPRHVVERLLPDRHAITSTRERLMRIKPSCSAATLYLATDAPPDELGVEHAELMLLGESSVYTGQPRLDCMAGGLPEEACEDAFWRTSAMAVSNYHKLDPRGGHVVCLNVLDVMSHWPERGTEAYRAKKERCAKALLGRLLDHRPDIGRHLTYQELATPRTYERYTNNHGGAGFGALIGPDAPAHSLLYDFPVKGVHFLSSWVAGPGYEAAFTYAEAMARMYGAERPTADSPPSPSTPFAAASV